MIEWFVMHGESKISYLEGTMSSNIYVSYRNIFFIFSSPSACNECKSEVVVSDDGQESVQEWCMDDQSYTKNKDDNKNCNWVGRTDARVEKLCPLNVISKNCPQACGLCCGDDSTYKFKSKKGIEKSCSWLNNNDRRDRYCDSVISGVLVSRKCPVSCGVCTPPDRTAVPSNSPSVSSSPTSSPTESPTAVPTDSAVPTSPPSSLPTVLPTKFPSASPIMSPTLQPSSAPSLVCVITARLAFPRNDEATYGYHNGKYILDLQSHLKSMLLSFKTHLLLRELKSQMIWF